MVRLILTHFHLTAINFVNRDRKFTSHTINDLGAFFNYKLLSNSYQSPHNKTFDCNLNLFIVDPIILIKEKNCVGSNLGSKSCLHP